MPFENTTQQDVIDDLKDIHEDLQETIDYLHDRSYSAETSNQIVAARRLIQSVIEEIENKQ